MKKLSMFCGIVLTLSLMFSPAFASMPFMLDLDQASPVDFETEVTVMEGNTFQVDVWLTNYTQTEAIDIIDYYFHWDTTSLDCAVPTEGADWDDNNIYSKDEVNGIYEVGVASNLGFIPSSGPDSKSTLLQSFVLTCTAAPGDDNFSAQLGDGGVGGKLGGWWTDVDDAYAVAHQTEPVCECDVTPDDPADIIGSGEEEFTAEQIVPDYCDNNPMWSWEIYNPGECVDGYLDGCGFGDATCLFKADSVSVAQNCMVAVADLNNWSGVPYQSAPVYCSEYIALYPLAGCASKIYRGGVCEESTPDDTIYNRPGRRELSITCCEEEEFCICTSCTDVTHRWYVEKVSGDPDFSVYEDLVTHTGIGDTFTLKVKDPCTVHCPDEAVELRVYIIEDGLPAIVFDEVFVQLGRVALGIGDTNAHPGTQTTDIDLLLWNYENHVRAIQADICGSEMDECNAYTQWGEDACDDTECAKITEDTACDAAYDCEWKTVGGVDQCVNRLNCVWANGECVAQDNMVCTACVVDEDRATEFICTANEQADGCCRVTLFNVEPDDLIQQGDGAVARIKYDIGEEKTSKDCIPLGPYDIKIADQYNEPLCAVPKHGEICFMVCGDVYPQDCYECESCGDGIVDLFDILEEIDIVLGLQTASICQMLHGDVPLGMPPYCGDPAGVNPPNCENDDVIDIFDALVIIDKALSRMNCCDYCMFGEIY